MVLPQVSGGACDAVAEKREEVLVQDEVAAMDCNGSPPGTRWIYYLPQVPGRACDAVAEHLHFIQFIAMHRHLGSYLHNTTVGQREQ